MPRLDLWLLYLVAVLGAVVVAVRGGSWCQDWILGCCFGWVLQRRCWGPRLDLWVVCCIGVVLVAVRDTDNEPEHEVAVLVCCRCASTSNMLWGGLCWCNRLTFFC